MKKLVTFLFLLFSFLGTARAQHAQWAQAQGKIFTGSTPNRLCLEADAHSLVYGGLIDDHITFGSQTFTGPGTTNSYHGFVAKFDHSGNVQWAKHLTGNVEAVVVALDVKEYVVVAGTFTGTITIDGQSISQPDFGVPFVAKFNPAGALLWLRPVTGNVSRHVAWPDLTTDKDGNIIIAGGYQSNVFIEKLDYAGNPVFFRNVVTNVHFPTIASPYYRSVSLDVSPQGEIFVAPHYSDFNSYTVRKVAKYSPTGNQEWIKDIQHPQGVLNHRFTVTADNHGNAYVSGSYSTSINFGTISLPYTNQNYYNKRNFLAKLNNAGKWVWAREVQGGYDADAFRIKSLKTNQLAIAGTFQGQVRLGTTWLGIGNNISNYVTIVAHLDTAGNPIKGYALGAANNYYNQYLHDLTADPKGNVYLTGQFSPSMNFGNFALNAVGPNPTGSYFLGKYLEAANALTGKLFLDMNNNGIKEPGELPYPEGIVEVSGLPLYLSTGDSGVYNTYLPTGAYNVKVINPSAHYSFSPQNHTVTFNATGQTLTKDFALAPIPNRDDLKITVTNITPARPGFQMKYRITFENVGTTTLSDTIFLNYNNQFLTFNSASESPLLQTPGKLAWFYQPLAPLEKRNIDVHFTVAPTTPINTQLMAHALANPVTDFINWNNQDTLHHLVTGSFDPNDKLVNRNWLTPQQVADSTLLNYVIRFQNTGNDTAFTVIVRDSISDKLHMPTFELLSASHPYTFRLLENGMAEWRFDNILLPDSNRNEPASHGFIRYRMQAKNNLVLGDEIKSRAAIYFDYNAPVLTNYAVTTVSLTNGIKEKFSNIQTFKLYPNPAKNYVMVAADFKKNTSASVTLLNLLGQTLSNVTLPANNQIHYQMPLYDLPKGIYLIRLETETGMQTQRLVIQ